MHNDSTTRRAMRVTSSCGTARWAARAAFLVATAAGLAACSDDTPMQPKSNLPKDGLKTPSAVINIIPEGTTFPAKIAFATGMPQGKEAKVQLYDAAHNQLASFYAFSSADDFYAGVNVAVGDVNGDGWPDIIAGEGPTTEVPLPSGQSKLSVWDGKTGTLLQTWIPFAGFKAGIRVGAGDLDLDGKTEILACTGEAVWGNRALALKLGSTTPVTGSQISALTPDGFAMSHGCRVAAGDLTGDGSPEMVAHFDGKNALLVVRDLQKMKDVQVRNPLGSYGREADVAVGDVNGDKIADVMLSFRQDSAVVRVFDGAKVKSTAPLTLLKELKPIYYWQYTGVDIAARDLNGDGVVDLLFKPTKAMPFWTYSAVGANAGPALTAVTGLFWFVEPGNLYPGGPVG